MLDLGREVGLFPGVHPDMHIYIPPGFGERIEPTFRGILFERMRLRIFRASLHPALDISLAAP